MKIFPMISLAFASLISFWASTYVTEARTIAATNEQTETSLFELLAHFEGLGGAFSSQTPPPPSVIQVEKNNGESDSEMASGAVGQSGSSDDAGQTGNAVDSDDDINALSDALLGDEDCGNGSKSSVGGEVMPTGDEGRNHSIQSSESCEDPSPDELRRKLLAGELFDLWETLQDTGDDWLAEGEKFSQNCSSGNLKKTALNRRATCPWTILQTEREGRYPSTITHAKCGRDCPHCGPRASCTQVLVDRHVLVKGECRDQFYEYTLAIEKVPVACVCVIDKDE